MLASATDVLSHENSERGGTKIPASRIGEEPLLLNLEPLRLEDSNENDGVERWLEAEFEKRLLERGGCEEIDDLTAGGTVAGAAAESDVDDEPALANAVRRRGCSDPTAHCLAREPVPPSFTLGTIFPASALACWHCGLPGSPGRPTVPVPIQLQEGRIDTVITSGECCSFPCAAARLHSLAGGGTTLYSRDLYMRYHTYLRIVYFSYTKTWHVGAFPRADPPQKSQIMYGGDQTPAEYAAHVYAIDPYSAWLDRGVPKVAAAGASASPEPPPRPKSPPVITRDMRVAALEYLRLLGAAVRGTKFG
jgi:hypothetical protein